MKRILMVLAIALASLMSQHAFAFADQGPNNETSYRDDEAARCNASKECTRAFQERYKKRETGVFDWAVVIAMLIFIVWFFGGNRRK